MKLKVGIKLLIFLNTVLNLPVWENTDGIPPTIQSAVAPVPSISNQLGSSFCHPMPIWHSSHLMLKWKTDIVLFCSSGTIWACICVYCWGRVLYSVVLCIYTPDTLHDHLTHPIASQPLCVKVLYWLMHNWFLGRRGIPLPAVCQGR